MYRVASKLASSISSASASKKRACSRFICNRNYVAKDINFGVGAQAAMLEGVSEVSEAVKTAMGLGPKMRFLEKACLFAMAKKKQALLIGFDVGKEHVGISISDPTLKSALDFNHFRRSEGISSLVRLLKVSRSEYFEKNAGFVIGYPYRCLEKTIELVLQGNNYTNVNEVLEFVSELMSVPELAHIDFTFFNGYKSTKDAYPLVGFKDEKEWENVHRHDLDLVDYFSAKANLAKASAKVVLKRYLDEMNQKYIATLPTP
ncbi:hypothetical protein Dsin_018701 [Dipteronia sinensis]|uniref:YqgF/RNase H-like domain-containing protein n=1 Tax=Dipteronia sinensis TaxID=43782 RepID=A0AAE0E223_9ROSI|nr:hypothetical protein Dsin_018701 [Dipteronia sinensis]